MKVRVETGSRLHFGLLAPGVRSGRRFGGAGLMTVQPGLRITLEDEERDVIEGPWKLRVETVLARVRVELSGSAERWPRVRVRVERSAPLHIGLGTGTQLALAVARGYLELVGHLAQQSDWEPRSAETLARLTERGARSGIGIHGFLHGGFLVDGGKPTGQVEQALAPLISRLEFPATWPILVFIPQRGEGLHGDRERLAFAGLEPVSEEFLDRQCRRLLLEILPAVAERNYEGFAEALHAYNRDAGQPFRQFQTGPYHDKLVAERIARLRNLGIRAAGQSSWGPTVFAIAADPDQARHALNQMACDPLFAGCHVVVTEARNQGATVVRESEITLGQPGT